MNKRRISFYERMRQIHELVTKKGELNVYDVVKALGVTPYYAYILLQMAGEYFDEFEYNPTKNALIKKGKK
ncbi:MAG: hypothetical protein RMJ14_06440 [Nitrososphaerota archaeon]|nr:hypothetical protein [Nitrososphaerota archaeon]